MMMPTITLANGSEAERQAQEQLERLHARYDLGRWTYTDMVQIDETCRIPHSHPALTLNTRYLEDDHTQLTTYVHEQLHWYLIDKNVREPTAQFREWYPELPVGYPDGCRDEFSNYLHLCLCPLELSALMGFIGVPAARDLLGRAGHYRRIYQIVLDDHERLMGVLAECRLIPEAMTL